jgi:hypothetical protein
MLLQFLIQNAYFLQKLALDVLVVRERFRSVFVQLCVIR